MSHQVQRRLQPEARRKTEGRPRSFPSPWREWNISEIFIKGMIPEWVGLSEWTGFGYNMVMEMRVPALIAAVCLTIYWGAVVVKLFRLARKIGKDPNAVPRERTGQLMRVVWYPVIIFLIVGLWMAVAGGGRGAAREVFKVRWEPMLWMVITASVLCILGTVATFVCWRKMGRSWRIGIDPGETLVLVSTGPYSRVRHPIYALRMVINVMICVMAPTLAVMIGAFVDFALLQVEARREEAYMESTHGEVYTRYKKSVRRFIPRLFLG